MTWWRPLRRPGAASKQTTSAESAATAASDSERAVEAVAGRDRKPKKRKKKVWTRERHVMRSAGRRDAVEAGEPAQQGKVAGGVVNDVLEVDPRGYREAMRSRHSMVV